MSLRDAKDLHADITKLLVTLEQIRSANTTTTTSIDLSGGDFKNS